MIKVKVSNPRNRDFMYPLIKDKKFQFKISNKKEFAYKYDSSEKSCEDTFFTLAPHQEFVKRFISYNSYYNGLLLYHGLGSGKTCSAIGITEETRKYIKYHPNFKPILIVASENVQENFKLQLFDENKLKKINGQWVIYGCLGSSLLDEVGLSNVNDLDKITIIRKIRKLIKKYYEFKGYIEFANMIEEREKKIDVLKKDFEDRMIVIDEIHNIKTVEENNKMQKVAKYLEFLVDKVNYMKLIFLTGTPMFNGAEEIVYMLNILNKNDKQKPIHKTKIFHNNGSFKEGGEEKLIHMANGYISYVRGENPYTFPHLISPKLFDTSHSFVTQQNYPRLLFNYKPLEQHINHLDLYLSPLEQTQQDVYMHSIEKYKKKKGEGLSYTELLKPLQCLNISYPADLEDEEDNEQGIRDIMDWELSGKPKVMHSFTYKKEPIFQYEKIGEYSTKIKTILDNIRESDGIILIYSQWIYYGVLPMALALEEMGYGRFGSENLIQNRKHKFKYSIICGNKELSPNINGDISALTNDNTNGERIKVVIISQTGTEGIDLKNIRQVHILEPWYNMNRIEQVIGRARRNCSHKELPNEKRNVQIFLHSVEPISTSNGSMEPVDMYMYRLNEKKNKIIGNVSKVLKQVSVDCLLNESQKDFARIKKEVMLSLSNGKVIRDFPIKDNPYTNICDYQETCEYTCLNKDVPKTNVDNSTYNYKHLSNHQIIYSLKSKFKEKHIYQDDELKDHMYKLYPFMKEEEYTYALDKLMNEDIYDKYDEKGKIIKIHHLLLFQPDIDEYEYLSAYERMMPTIQEDSLEMNPIYIKKEDNETYLSFQQNIHDTIDQIKNTILYKDFSYITNSFTDIMKDDSLLESLVIERNFDYLNIKDQIYLLNYIHTQNKQPIKDILYRKYVQNNTIILNNTMTNDKDKRGKIELYSLEEDGPWEKIDQEPIFELKKKDSSHLGYIKLISQSRFVKRPEFDYRPKYKIMDFIQSILKTRKESLLPKKTSKLSPKTTLEIILELYLRYLDNLDKETKYFYCKYEIKQLDIKN